MYFHGIQKGHIVPVKIVRLIKRGNTMTETIERLRTPVQIGKNRITEYREKKGWIIEIFEFGDSEGKPMYSCWDIVKKREIAVKLATILIPKNELKVHQEWQEKHPEVFVGYEEN